MKIHTLPCLEDNYSFLIKDESSCFAVDVPDAKAMIKLSDKLSCRIEYLLNTHYHSDHVFGNDELKSHYDLTIIGPKYESDKISSIDKEVVDGDRFKIGGREIHVFHVPGHTSGMINYYIPSASVLFTADCIFSAGCGRVSSDCTFDQMWESLLKLRSLPNDTKIYFAHEYTQKNIEFALTVMPENKHLKEYKQEVDELIKKNIPTTPSTLEKELLVNPFLRADKENFVGIDNSLGPLEKFKTLRKLKDNF